MQIEYFPTTDVTTLKNTIESRNTSPEFKSHIVFACDENNWQTSDLDSWLQQQRVPVFGAIFPQIIFSQTNYQQGFILLSLSKTINWTLVPKLSDIEQNYDHVLEPVAEVWEEDLDDSTLFVFADGMASRIAALIESLFFNFGLLRNFVGGGAGSLSFQQKPCILCPQGLLQDVAIVLNVPLQSGIGVAHGWQAVSEPIKVSRSDRNIIQKLDYQNAFQQYKEVVLQQGGGDITQDNFFDIAKSYPFGIIKLDAEMVVRDPLMPTEDGKGLVCVGEVPEECFVRVLNGTPQQLIEAAAEVKKRADSDWARRYENTPKLGLFIDCISRVLFLEDKIDEEIAQVSDPAMPLFGALTLGEIANNGQEYLEFYNKTAVLCVLGEE